MRGVLIWAYSECRSTMATYRALINALGVPGAVVVLHANAEGCGMGLRAQTGFRPDEFLDMQKIAVGIDLNLGLKIIEEHVGWDHIFCDYQGSAVVRRLICEAKHRGSRIVIATESPCNMFFGWRRLAKELFFRTILPFKVRDVVRAADCLVSCSGEKKYAHLFGGWPEDKVISFGYFPPPIEGSKCVKRETAHPFTILSTGVLSRYRGADVLVEALRILKEDGVSYTATITQDGELLPELKDKARKYNLPIAFPGKLPLSELIKQYESCAVYVGAGRCEPWGMRINDALNCGAPLLVSRGMGAAKLVDDYKCGLTCSAGDPVDMARKLKKLAVDQNLYAKVAHNAFAVHYEVSPEAKAKWLAARIFK